MPNPSILLIAVENFPGINFSCSPYEESEKSGFRVLCDEAIRFTHAYTPSPLSQAAMGALLTASHPLKNGLRDNGNSFLTARTITIPERLLSQGIKTFITIASPTIKRNSRLHQGFHVFDDEYPMTHKTFFRPIVESRKIFTEWLEQEGTETPFLGIIHSSDLLFSHLSTQTANLEQRPRGFEGQMEEIDEELYLLFESLRQKNIWNTTYVIVVGLNGVSNPTRLNETPATNLFAENVQVPLFIKPLKGREEIPHQWKIDVHVALQDVGATISDIFNLRDNSPPSTNSFSGRSLLPFINGRPPRGFDKPSLLIESSWGPWSQRAYSRYSVRDTQWLLFFDRKPSLYNTLTDRNEFNRISLKNEDYQSVLKEKSDLYGSEIRQNYEKPDSSLNEEFRLAQVVIDSEGRQLGPFLKEIETLILQNPHSQTMRWLLTLRLAKDKNWNLLSKFNNYWDDPLIHNLIHLTDPTLSSKSDSKQRGFQCLMLIKRKVLGDSSFDPQNRCLDSEFILLSDFLSKKELDPMLTEKIATLMRHKILRLNLILFDQAKGGILLGAHTKELKELTLMRSLLYLPKFYKHQQAIESHLN